MTPSPVAFPAEPDDDALDALAGQVAPRLFRTRLDEPGWALLDLGAALDPRGFRDRLVRLGHALGRHYRRHFGEALRFVSVSRFDQQAPTRPHRDGGPDASVLLLGYEPTEVASTVVLLDYTRAAAERGLTPQGFLDCCNPAFGGDPAALRAHTAAPAGFSPDRYQVLLVNNSCLDLSRADRGMLGVLHHAVIHRPLPGRPRHIASVLMGVTPDALDDEPLRAFVDDATPATR
jgi:hypothetical protein